MSRKFPIHPYSMRDEKWFPRFVPWEKLAHIEAQAKSNHSQTLERLAARGGLSPEELWLAYNGKDLREMRAMTAEEHIAALKLIVDLSVTETPKKEK